MVFLFSKKPVLTGEVSILIPTRFDGRYRIELCLKTIKKYTGYRHYQIIIGDAGVDEPTRDYLIELSKTDDIKLARVTDPERPKDDLVKIVDTEYYMFMHDDIMITRQGWLERRLYLMNKDKNNAVVGSIVRNGGKAKGLRFFPLGLLVKTEVSRKLGLTWGKQPPALDTGALAHRMFFAQKEFKFVNYKMNKDIYHFANLTWPQIKTKENYPKLDERMREREEKMQIIRNILEKNAY